MFSIIDQSGLVTKYCLSLRNKNASRISFSLIYQTHDRKKKVKVFGNLYLEANLGKNPCIFTEARQI